MIAAVDPEQLVRRGVRLEGDDLFLHNNRLHLGGCTRVHILGAGKAAAPMSAGIRRILGNRLTGGVIISTGASPGPAGPVDHGTGDHPVPGRRSLAATRELLGYVDTQIGPDDLVLFLISGGASSLLTAPLPGVNQRKWRRLQAALVTRGLPIREINLVRSAFSLVKAGGLAARIYPASLWTLAISDVIGSAPETIGSGPTTRISPPEREKVRRILENHGLAVFIPLLDNIPPRRESPEYPPGGYLVIGDNRTALEAGRDAAADLDFPARILTRRLQGPVDVAARRLGRVMRRQRPASGKQALLFGGETTVRITGRGRGGRNQELMLRLLGELRDLPGPWLAACLGSDGVDGNSPAAGAWISHHAAARLRGREKEMETALRKNDSYRFFRKNNGLIETGPTGTNVMDLGVILLP